MNPYHVSVFHAGRGEYQVKARELKKVVAEFDARTRAEALNIANRLCQRYDLNAFEFVQHVRCVHGVAGANPKGEHEA